MARRYSLVWLRVLLNFQQKLLCIASMMHFLVICTLFLGSNAIEITTKQGILKGFEQISRNGTKFQAFLGIPYAKPPVGNLRFESPQPPDSWTGVRDATKPPPSCVQKEMIFRYGESVVGQEDCLYLNVYAPVNIKSPLPVMVWIHGGALIEGSGYFYGPNYLLDHDIIIVTINYRLGVIGFLSAADEILPGNYGMKDQVAALKWVQQNIQAFGGDPQRVTIFGESAGAASAHLHLYSPLSKGLFHRAICQSGSALASWAQITPSMARQRFTTFGMLAGCSVESTRAMVDCLKKISAKELVEIAQKFYVWDVQPIITFTIVRELRTVADAFLIRNPWKDTVLNEVPLIIGMNPAEGVVLAGRFLSDGGNRAKEFNQIYKRLMPVIFGYVSWVKSHKIDAISEDLKKFYFKDQEIGLETATGLVNLIGDSYFIYDCIVAAQRHTNKVFVYYYDHKGAQSFGKVFGNTSLDLGVSHADDLFNLFSFTFSLKNYSLEDLSVSQRLVKYWIDFAYNGNPTLDGSWKASKSPELDYLLIKTKGDCMKTSLLHDRYLFWKNSMAHPINLFHDKNVNNCKLRPVYE